MNIILAVTGSISAYKAIDLAKELKKDHNVQVVVSSSAKQFLNPKIFNYFNIPVHENDFDSDGVLHVTLARWADTFVLCPATAHKISTISNGQCEDLISSVFLSLKDEVTKIIVPAMNVEMFKNKMTQSNLEKLSKMNLNVHVIQPDSGLLACGEKGEGKLPDVKTLKEIIPILNNKKRNKKVLITAGATVVPLDTVRFISNPGKGGTGYLLAKKFLAEGYEVHVIKGVNSTDSFKHLRKHKNYSEEVVTTTDDLFEKVSGVVKNYDVYISPMAVSDIKIDKPHQGKLKKKDLNNISITTAPDVLKYVVENKTDKQVVVGFAAESSLDDSVINEKITRKPVDLLVVNQVDSGLNGGNKKGFGTNEGDYRFATKEEISEVISLNKNEVAEKIVEFVKSKE